MAWEQNLVSCLFGGIRFHAAAISGNQGRRIITHNLINAAPVSEDIGPASRNYTIQGYLVQNLETPDPYTDYTRLRELVLRGGPQRFIHPHFGEVMNAKGVTIVERVSNRAGGFIAFTLTIDANKSVEYIPPKQPTDVALGQKAVAVRGAAIRLFGPEEVANFDPVTPIDLSPDSPFTRFQAVQSPIEETGFVASVQRILNQVKEARGALKESGAAAFRRLDDALSGPANLYRDGANLAADVNELLDGFQGVSAASGPLEIAEYFLRNPITPGIRGDTIFHQRAANNDYALTNLATLLSVSAFGRFLGENPIRGVYKDRAGARKNMRRMSDATNSAKDIMQKNGAERSALALSDFNAALVDYQDEHLPQLSRLRSERVQNRNAYYSAYRYLNDSNQVTRLVEENNSLHIFKMPENVDLRVA